MFFRPLIFWINKTVSQKKGWRPSKDYIFNLLKHFECLAQAYMTQCVSCFAHIFLITNINTSNVRQRVTIIIVRSSDSQIRSLWILAVGQVIYISSYIIKGSIKYSLSCNFIRKHRKIKLLWSTAFSMRKPRSSMPSSLSSSISNFYRCYWSRSKSKLTQNLWLTRMN